MFVFHNVRNYIDRDARFRKEAIEVESHWEGFICEEANKSPWPVAEVGT